MTRLETYQVFIDNYGSDNLLALHAAYDLIINLPVEVLEQD